MNPSRPLLLLLCPLLLVLSGCGSKINESNYYKVVQGATEAQVEKLLGPGRPGSAQDVPPGSRATAKRWEQAHLKIVVLFEDGRVVGRRAEGLPGGVSESFHWPGAATLPIVTPRDD